MNRTRNGRKTLRALTALLASTFAACGNAGASAEWDVRETASPAGETSGQPNLHAAEGSAYLSWLETTAEGRHALRFSRWEGGRWSEPRTVAEGEHYFVNWADFPSLVALGGDRLAAHWLVRSGDATYAYDVHVAQSADGGRSWSEAVVPHRDGTQTEHGFVSLFPWSDGRLSAVWLDGRDFARVGADDAHASGADMALRHTTLDTDGALGPEGVLDPRVCDCCQTTVALTASGPLVVYRDRSDEEIRDISAVRYVDGAWTTPRPVHRDGWRIHGCPVNGPAAAAEGERVAIAWFTAANDTARVLVAFSDDGGASFSMPVRVDEGDPVGRVAIVVRADGDAVVSWVERVGESAEIRFRRVSPSAAGAGHRLSGTSAARASGFPRMALLGDQLLFAWTDAGEPSRVRTAVATVP